MKLVMDEKLKHRLIGLAVIISLGAIFAPAMVRKSTQHFDNNFSVNIKLPPKPMSPDVAATEEKDMFKTIKIARVRIPPVPENKAANQISKAEPIQSAHVDAKTTAQVASKESENRLEPIKFALKQSATTTVNKAVKVAANTSMKQVKSLPVIAKKASVRAIKVAQVKAKAKPVVNKSLYAIQLASFSQVTNAQSLVNKLHSKGYKANYIKVSGRNGAVYKVFAGHSVHKTEVIKLKSQLASAMQLKGFVVNTGVS